MDAAQVLHVAPMLAVTDEHHRALCRLLSSSATLWTEMVHADAVKHNAAAVLPPNRLGRVVCQLGGSQPAALAAAALAAQDAGYSEVNLNCGCPSAKVCRKGDERLCFGAKLMLQPALAAECVRRMAEAVDVPVSVKCRLGVDARAEYEDLLAFVDAVGAGTGLSHVVVHARAALLGVRVSTSKNRSAPPLDYGAVYRLRREQPRLRVTLNGGVQSLEAAEEHLRDGKVDGVMLGRAVQHNPLILRDADARFYAARAPPPRTAHVLATYEAYCAGLQSERARRKALRHLGIGALERAAAWLKTQPDAAAEDAFPGLTIAV